ncbi:uncharacterized protein [Procambarus clarkii]|uniref:uncharacterized protein n=1 Tax=Procambarus clarkii TaxID=6728 RepID=UPI0037432D25
MAENYQLAGKTFRSDPAGEIGTLCRAKRTELQALADEYQLEVPHGANKNDLHNLLMDHLLDEGTIYSETHETHSIADKNAQANIKIKLDLAKLEREQQKEPLHQQKKVLQMRKEEAAIRKEKQEREAALKKPFRNNPAGEIGTLCRAKRTELQALAHEYQLEIPQGANKNDLHNLLMDHLLDEGTIYSETHETHSIADKNAQATIKLKLELAIREREQQKEALQQQKEVLQMRKEEAAIRKEKQEREVALKEREMVLFRERERVQLEVKQRHLEIQREHDKQQADMAIECRQRELTLETTHHTQSQQAHR